MSRYRLVTAALGAGGLAAAALAVATSGAFTTSTARIARGAYLAAIAGCHDCHTPGTFYGAPDFGRAISGSEVGWRSAFGVAFPRNLTPMPWPNYARLSDADAYAIAAYLESLAPIEHRVPDRIPPGVRPHGPVVTLPPPPAWDAPRGATAAGTPGTARE